MNLDRLRHRCRENDSLPLALKIRENGFNVFVEAHVLSDNQERRVGFATKEMLMMPVATHKHTVALIQHHILAEVESEAFLCQVVN